MSSGLTVLRSNIDIFAVKFFSLGVDNPGSFFVRILAHGFFGGGTA